MSGQEVRSWSEKIAELDAHRKDLEARLNTAAASQ